MKFKVRTILESWVRKKFQTLPKFLKFALLPNFPGLRVARYQKSKREGSIPKILDRRST